MAGSIPVRFRSATAGWPAFGLCCRAATTPRGGRSIAQLRRIARYVRRQVRGARRHRDRRVNQYHLCDRDRNISNRGVTRERVPQQFSALRPPAALRRPTASSTSLRSPLPAPTCSQADRRLGRRTSAGSAPALGGSAGGNHTRPATPPAATKTGICGNQKFLRACRRHVTLHGRTRQKALPFPRLASFGATGLLLRLPATRDLLQGCQAPQFVSRRPAIDPAPTPDLDRRHT